MANHEQNFKDLPILPSDPRWRPKFLDVLLKTDGDVAAAANAAGILPVIAYQAAYKDPDFAQDWDEVRQMIREKRSDAIEESMTKAATRIEEPDTRAGKLLLQGYRPTTFRDPIKDAAKDAIRSVADLFRVMEQRDQAARRALPPVTIERIDTPPSIDVVPEPEKKPAPLFTKRKKTEKGEPN